MAAPLSLSLSVSLCVCVSLSVSLYLCLSPSPVCLIAEGMWSSCRRLQNSTRHFRELMSLYYCTSSKQAALATCVSQSGRSHALLTRHTTADCTKISPGVVAVLRAWAEGPQRRRRRKRHRLCDPWAYGAGPNRWCAALAHLLAPVGGTLRRAPGGSSRVAGPAVGAGAVEPPAGPCARGNARPSAAPCTDTVSVAPCRPSSRGARIRMLGRGVQRKPSSRADSRF